MKTFRKKPFWFATIVLLALTGVAVWAQTAALSNRLSNADPKKPKFLIITLSTGTSVQASLTNLQFTTATFYGYKAVSATAAPTVNSSSAYLGFVDATGGSGVSQGSPAFIETITPGSYITLSPIGTKYNLMDMYFLGSTGDKVLVVYSE